MSDLRDQIQTYLKKLALIPPNCLVLTAVSGGADSISLLHILNALRCEWPFDLHVAHLNHQIRPQAGQDEDFVIETAKNLNLPFTVDTCDILKKAQQEKKSLEDAAREARRKFLTKTAKQIGASRVALGHTKSDQAETLLFRILRGTSPTGLGGMRPITDNFWIRPLLETSRKQVEMYVNHHQLRFCTDETNTDTRFARNKIRHELLPFLKTHFTPQVETALTRLANIVQEEDVFLDKHSHKALQKVTLYRTEQKIILDVEQVFGYHISLRRRLFKKALFGLGIADNTVTFEVIERLISSLTKNHAHFQITADLSAYRSKQGLLILTSPAPPFNMPICLSGKTIIPTQNAQIFAKKSAASQLRLVKPEDAYTVLFDADQLPGKLHIRQVQPGDRIRLFGIDGSQKVSKLLRDEKIPKPLRGDIPVLVGDNQILWVLGLRRSNVAPITPKTKQIQQLIFSGGWQRIVTHPETR